MTQQEARQKRLATLRASRDEAADMLRAARMSRDSDGKEVPGLRNLVDEANKAIERERRG